MAFIPDNDQPPASFAETCSHPGCENPVSEWAGRGRRPTKCDEHKGSRLTSISGGKKSTAGEPSDIARKAARVLAQGNTLVAAMISLWFPITARALVDDDVRNAFIESAALALDSDPALCRKILKGGTDSAKIGLVMAYGTLIANLAPVVMAEVREKAAAREAQRQESDG